MTNNNKNEKKIYLEVKLPNKTISIPSEIERLPHTVTYNAATMAKIIMEIATDVSRPISVIQTDNGVPPGTIYAYMLVSPPLREAYYYVRRMRETAKVDALEITNCKILDQIEAHDIDDKIDLRALDCRIRAHRVNSLNVQWAASRLVPQYRNTQEIEVTVNDSIAKRRQAWEQRQKQLQAQGMIEDADVVEEPDTNDDNDE